MVELNNFQKDSKRRVNSLEMGSGELSIIEATKSDKNAVSKTKNIINNCLSDRNIVSNRDQQKLFKYRKFSSNADLPIE